MKRSPLKILVYRIHSIICIRLLQKQICIGYIFIFNTHERSGKHGGYNDFTEIVKLTINTKIYKL